MKGNICGNKIKELRTSKQWSQVELSAALSVDYGLVLDQSDISEIERGVRGVKDYELKALAEIFGVKITSLIEDSFNEYF